MWMCDTEPTLNPILFTNCSFFYYYGNNLVLAYITIGTWLVFVCQAIGEIATLLPIPGAFTAWGSRVFDEAFSFQL